MEFFTIHSHPTQGQETLSTVHYLIMSGYAIRETAHLKVLVFQLCVQVKINMPFLCMTFTNMEQKFLKVSLAGLSLTIWSAVQAVWANHFCSSKWSGLDDHLCTLAYTIKTCDVGSIILLSTDVGESTFLSGSTICHVSQNISDRQEWSRGPILCPPF